MISRKRSVPDPFAATDCANAQQVALSRVRGQLAMNAAGSHGQTQIGGIRAGRLRISPLEGAWIAPRNITLAAAAHILDKGVRWLRPRLDDRGFPVRTLWFPRRHAGFARCAAQEPT